jgi:hypothetical protein
MDHLLDLLCTQHVFEVEDGNRNNYTPTRQQRNPAA